MELKQYLNISAAKNPWMFIAGTEQLLMLGIFPEKIL